MKKLTYEAFVLGIIVLAILIAGCTQPEAQSVKMSRIIAAENMQLKEELRKSDWEINNLKEQHQEQVNKLEKLIAEYKEQIRTWQEESRRNIRSQVKDVLDLVLEQNAKLKQENDSLKAQIGQLKPSN